MIVLGCCANLMRLKVNDYLQKSCKASTSGNMTLGMLRWKKVAWWSMVYGSWSGWWDSLAVILRRLCGSRCLGCGTWDGGRYMVNDYWLLIIDIVHTENADDTEVRRRTLWENANYRKLYVNWRKKYISTDDTDGGPQADGGVERESSEFKQNLNGGPQADGGGERQLENNKYPQMSQMEARKRTMVGNSNCQKLDSN